MSPLPSIPYFSSAESLNLKAEFIELSNEDVKLRSVEISGK